MILHRNALAGVEYSEPKISRGFPSTAPDAVDSVSQLIVSDRKSASIDSSIECAGRDQIGPRQVAFRSLNPYINVPVGLPYPSPGITYADPKDDPRKTSERQHPARSRAGVPKLTTSPLCSRLGSCYDHWKVGVRVHCNCSGERRLLQRHDAAGLILRFAQPECWLRLSSVLGG